MTRPLAVHRVAVTVTATPTTSSARYPPRQGGIIGMATPEQSNAPRQLRTTRRTAAVVGRSRFFVTDFAA